MVGIPMPNMTLTLPTRSLYLSLFMMPVVVRLSGRGYPESSLAALRSSNLSLASNRGHVAAGGEYA